MVVTCDVPETTEGKVPLNFTQAVPCPCTKRRKNVQFSVGGGSRHFMDSLSLEAVDSQTTILVERIPDNPSVDLDEERNVREEI